ncbi:hypothetical protein ABZX75_27595 [Streptomyces sp. NPDC003038]|uniref:hypothetical protein n=1 Tax=unclassified Streptomyces TaxID=2593676 RepID=UPI0033B39FD2
MPAEGDAVVFRLGADVPGAGGFRDPAGDVAGAVGETDGSAAADADGEGDGEADSVGPAPGVGEPGLSATGGAPPVPPEQPPTSRPPASNRATAPGTLLRELTPTTHPRETIIR